MMPRHLFWIRIGAAAVLTVALTTLAVQIVPGATVAVQLRMMAFVLVAPWAIALIVVRPTPLIRAFSAAFLGRPVAERTTLRVLELLGGLTILAGVIGAFGSYIRLLETVSVIKEYLGREVVPGEVASLIMAPAFALIVRLTVFEPVIWSLRRSFAPADAAPKALPTRWKVGLIVVATVLAVEGLHFVVGKLTKWEEPIPDTSFAVVRQESAAVDPKAVKPIRIELLQGKAGTECRADGEPVVAEFGRADEIYNAILRESWDRRRRPFEIAVAPAVPYEHLIVALDACIRLRTPRGEEDEEDEDGDEGENADGQEIRLVAPSESPLAVEPRVRLVHVDDRSPRHLVLVQLPRSNVSEPQAIAEDEPLVIVVTYRDRVAEIRVNRDVLTLDELKRWLQPIARARVNRDAGASEVAILIHCDKDVPSSVLLDILTLLGSEDLRISNVLLEVFPTHDRPGY